MATIDGDDSDNVLSGGPEDDLAQGFGGSDWLSGNGGHDTLIGGAGDDAMRGGFGNDHFIGNAPGVDADEYDQVLYHLDTNLIHGVNVDLALGQGTDGWGGRDTYEDIWRVTGTHFNDVIQGNNETNSFSGGAGDDLIDGRGGWDVVSYGRAEGGVVVDLAAGMASGRDGNDVLVSIEAVHGSNHSDRIYGSDRLREWFTLDEEFNANSGVGADDFLDGRGGQDGVAYVDQLERVTINLQMDRAEDGSGHVDTLLGVEMARGSQGSDRITGANGETNFLDGQAGKDWISGLSGEDELWGGEGQDTLQGGRGQDILEGGKGNDDFVFKSVRESGPSGAKRDYIEDFRGKDQIVLRKIDADKTDMGNQAFSLDAGGGFDVGEIRVKDTKAGVMLEMNIDNDARAEMSLLLLDFTGRINDADFVF